MYVMDMTSKWEDYLYLVEFSYNNSYQAYLKMSPVKELYGITCSIPDDSCRIGKGPMDPL